MPMYMYTARNVRTEHDHPSNPKKQNVIPSFQNAGRVKPVKITTPQIPAITVASPVPFRDTGLATLGKRVVVGPAQR